MCRGSCESGCGAAGGACRGWYSEGRRSLVSTPPLELLYRNARRQIAERYTEPGDDFLLVDGAFLPAERPKTGQRGLPALSRAEGAA
jgi:hypothetical protein